MAKRKKASKDERALFSRFLRDELRKRAWSQKDFAEEVSCHGVKMSFEVFRSRLMKNDFRGNELAAIAAVLDPTIAASNRRAVVDAWEKKHDLGVKRDEDAESAAAPESLATAIRQVDRKRRKLDAHLRAFAREIVPLLGRMQEGDYSVSTAATSMPIEFDTTAPPEVVEALARGVANGGVYLYLTPTQEAVVKHFRKGWEFDMVEAPDEIRVQLERVQGEVARRLEMKYERYIGSPREAKETALKQIRLYEIEPLGPFWAAGFTLGMFHAASDKDHIVRRMTVRVPAQAGKGYALLQPPDYERFGKRFNSWVVGELGKLKDKGIDKDILGTVIKALSEEPATSGASYMI